MRTEELNFGISSQASPARTPSSSDSIEPTDTKSWTPTSSQASNRFERLPRSGSRITTRIGPIRPTGSCHPFRTGNNPNQQKCPPSEYLIDGGDYTSSAHRQKLPVRLSNSGAKASCSYVNFERFMANPFLRVVSPAISSFQMPKILG